MSCITRRLVTRSLLLLLILSSALSLHALPRDQRGPVLPTANTVDNQTYIDANQILMFVTNHGNFGRDLSDVFGYDYGTFYPYLNPDQITWGLHTSSPLYAGGLWVGAVDQATGDTLVTVSEYSSEFVPGPMLGGTYQADRPEFRVYKLYRDSLAGNPNQDYLDWPTDQGAPVNGDGTPMIMGDQLLWTVFNDADPVAHNNNNASTAPLGIEVQQTVWAVDESGVIDIPTGGELGVTDPGDPMLIVRATVIDAYDITGHEYVVEADSVGNDYLWRLIDITEGDTLLANQTDLTGTNATVTDGFLVQVTANNGIKNFLAVANGAGVLDPPDAAAFGFDLFPVPNDPANGTNISDDQQVGLGKWAIHTADNGGSSGGGEYRYFQDFLSRTFRDDPERLARFGNYDWEIRFTGSNDNPGVDGGYAWDPFEGTPVAYWVPFELWRIGEDTPDDPSDDVRCIPYIIGDWDDADGNDDNLLFDLSNYGSSAGITCHDGCEHSGSNGDNDPYTDRIYWHIPVDDSPGEAGYQAFETAIIADPVNYPVRIHENPVMDRMVLINWNGGEWPPFTQALPEQGTVFRIESGGPASGLQVAINTSQPSTLTTTGPNGLTIYMKYKIANQGSKNLTDLFVSLWFDPDLGGSGDDYVGCDPATASFFCYNEDNDDGQYGFSPPVLGVKVLEGPQVVSPGDTATVDGERWVGYKNLDMYSFTKYFNGTDPDNYQESYQYMNGLDAKAGGLPFTNPVTMQETRFMVDGDPVTGTGWLDEWADDRRMMATYGPMDFPPGGETQITFKLAVGQGTDRLTSVTVLRQVLAYQAIPTGVEEPGDGTLPGRFVVHQNYPNPFNPETTIRYELPERVDVDIAVFNILGQRVKTLFRGELPGGTHRIEWDGTDEAGRLTSSGVYFYRIAAGDRMATRKMLLLK